MSRRIVFKGGGSAPFTVAAAGRDADGDRSDFENLIFNGNQPPLRLWGKSVVVVPGIQANNNAIGVIAKGGSIMPTPAGLWPLFCVVGQFTSDAGPSKRPITGPFFTSPSGYGSGFGGALSSDGYFYGVNFTTRRTPQGETPQSLAYQIYYAIFKNYG